MIAGKSRCKAVNRQDASNRSVCHRLRHRDQRDGETGDEIRAQRMACVIGDTTRDNQSIQGLRHFASSSARQLYETFSARQVFSASVRHSVRHPLTLPQMLCAFSSPSRAHTPAHTRPQCTPPPCASRQCARRRSSRTRGTGDSRSCNDTWRHTLAWSKNTPHTCRGQAECCGNRSGTIRTIHGTTETPRRVISRCKSSCR